MTASKTPEPPLQVAAIPTGPSYYQPIAAVPPVAPVKGRPSDGDGDADGSQKARATPPAGVGTLLDITA